MTQLNPERGSAPANASSGTEGSQSERVCFPVDGPRPRDDYFAARPPVPGVRPCKRLAIGTARVAAHYRTGLHEEAIRTLHTAWKDGSLLTDTAPAYGKAELLVSEAIARWNGDPPVVATKTSQSPTDLKSVQGTFNKSIQTLGPIDLVAVHDPKADVPDDVRTAISALLKGQVDDGIVKGLGVGGGGAANQSRWLETGAYRYIITHNRLGALSLQALADTVPLARKHGVTLWAASPLFMGLLGNIQPADLDLVRGYLPSVYFARAERVRQLASEASIPVSRLALRFLLSMPMVDIVVAGPASPQEWSDCQAACEAGPLPADLYARVWQAAQEGDETITGG
jgi:aryl-alcohol dehydrogenase-like predicted oxidoreductase